MNEQFVRHWDNYLMKGKSELYNTILKEISKIFHTVKIVDIKCELNEYKYIVFLLEFSGYKIINKSYNDLNNNCNIEFNV